MFDMLIHASLLFVIFLGLEFNKYAALLPLTMLITVFPSQAYLGGKNVLQMWKCLWKWSPS